MGCVKLTVKTHAAPPNAIDSKRFGVLTFGVAMVLQSRRYKSEKDSAEDIHCVSFGMRNKLDVEEKSRGRETSFWLAEGGALVSVRFSTTTKH
jgi:hypothetical protein